jgi:hypothetical protein
VPKKTKYSVLGGVEPEVAMVQRKLKLAQENQDNHFQRLRQLRQVYRAARDPGLYNIPTRAQYVIPLAFEKVETAVPRIISILFSTDPPIQSRWRVERDASEEDRKLRVLDHLFSWNYNSNYTPSWYWKIYGWIKETMIYGQSYLKIGWKHKIKIYEVKKPAMFGLMERTVEEKEILEDAVDLQTPSIFNMYFAPDAVAPDIIGTASWLIEHSRVPKSKIVAAKGTKYLDFDENQLHGGSEVENTESELEQDLERNASTGDDDDDPMVDVYEYWENDRVIVTANHSVLLRNEENPFGLKGKQKRKPYVCAIDYLILNELWQIGEVEMIKDIQNEMTTLRRMRTDVNNLTINPMWLINRTADVNEAELGLSRPGGFVHAMPQNGSLSDAVQQLRVGATTGLSSEEFQLLLKDAERITGQHDYSVGAAPERKETATAVQLLQAAANMRYDIKVRSFAHSFMEANYMIFERWKQLLTKPHPLRIPLQGQTGFEYVLVTKDILPEYDDVDLVTTGDPAMLMKDARKQEIAQLYEMINNNQFVMPQTKLKMLAIAAKAREIEGVDTLLRDLEMAQQMLPQAPSMMLPGGEGEPTPQAGSEAPMPEMPEKPGGAPMANENPGVSPFPRPER